MTEPLFQVLNDFHSDYVAALPQWTVFRDAYEGAADVMPRYLIRHEREAADIHRQRRARAYYLNYVAAVVDLHVAYLFRTPPLVQPASDAAADYESFLRNADRSGTALHYVLADAARLASIYGHVGLLVDVPSTESRPVTSEADRLNRAVRPYLVVVPPTAIVDWSVDAAGRLRWVRIAEESPDERSPFVPRGDGVAALYRTFTQHEWFLDAVEKDTATRLASGRHDLGRVPMTFCYNGGKRPGSILGVSAIRDIARINIAIYNWCSLLDEEVYNKCLNILLVPSAGSGEEIVIGSRNVLEYDPVAGQPPSYLAPPTEPLTSILDLIQRAQGWIYRLAKLGGVRKLQETGQIGSGLALKQEFLETNQALREKADHLENATKQVMDIVSLYLGRDGFDGVVDFPEEFGVRDYEVELDLVTKMRSALRAPTAVRAAERNFCMSYFANVSKDDKRRILQEIESEP